MELLAKLSALHRSIRTEKATVERLTNMVALKKEYLATAAEYSQLLVDDAEESIRRSMIYESR